MANEKIIHLDIISPRESVYSGEVNSITAPGSKGSFQILFSHAPIVSTLDIGLLTLVEPDGKKRVYAVSGGLIESSSNKVSAIVEEAIESVAIDLASANSALKQAESMLAQASDEFEKTAARKLILKSKNLIKAKETV